MRFLFFLFFLVSFVSSAQNNSSFLSLNDGSLVKFNSNTCQTAIVGFPGVMFDIAITPSGRLFGTTSLDLYEIDTTTGNSAFVANIFTTGYGVNNLCALNDSFLLSISGAELYKISTQDGSKTLLGIDTLFYVSSGDITYYKGAFYLAKWNNRLVKFQLNNTQTALVSVETVGTMTTDYGEVWGVLTIGDSDCTTDNLKLLAFEGIKVYEVNGESAQTMVLCDSIAPFAVTGATSLSEVHKQFSDSGLEFPNVFTPNSDGINDFFSVRTSHNIESLRIVILDRWGVVLFESSDLDFQWNGEVSSGISCNEGVYFYLANYTDYCGNNFKTNGELTLLR